jgi:hypothetical protein
MGNVYFGAFNLYHAPGINIASSFAYIKFWPNNRCTFGRNHSSELGCFDWPCWYYAYLRCIYGIGKAIRSCNKSYMGFGAGTAVIVDAIMVVLYIAYLLLTIKRNI